MKLAVFDRGNRNLKVLLFDDDKIVHRDLFEGGAEMGALYGIVKDFGAMYAAASSVWPEWSKDASIFFESREVHFFNVSGSVSFPFELLVDNPTSVGPDRLSAAVGALHIGYREAVLVDIGTAVTVDLLTERGFEGGAIFPGIELMKKSLVSGTAMIAEEVLERSRAEPPGHDTVEAVASGTFWAVVAAVERLVSLERGAAGKDLPVIITGRGSESLMDCLGFEPIFESDLVPLGVYELFRLNH